LILFPRRSGQYKKLDSSPEDVKAAQTAVKEGKEGYARNVDALFPVTNLSRAEAVTEISKSKVPKVDKSAYRTLRDARSDARLIGVREKRAKAKADEAAAAKK
jgi:large subunit ribosomal protein L13e